MPPEGLTNLGRGSVEESCGERRDHRNAERLGMGRRHSQESERHPCPGVAHDAADPSSPTSSFRHTQGALPRVAHSGDRSANHHEPAKHHEPRPPCVDVEHRGQEHSRDGPASIHRARKVGHDGDRHRDHHTDQPGRDPRTGRCAAPTRSARSSCDEQPQIHCCGCPEHGTPDHRHQNVVVDLGVQRFGEGSGRSRHQTADQQNRPTGQKRIPDPPGWVASAQRQQPVGHQGSAQRQCPRPLDPANHQGGCSGPEQDERHQARPSFLPIPGQSGAFEPQTGQRGHPVPDGEQRPDAGRQLQA